MQNCVTVADFNPDVQAFAQVLWEKYQPADGRVRLYGIPKN